MGVLKRGFPRIAVLFLLGFWVGCGSPLPKEKTGETTRLYASGAGTLRLLVYLDVADRIVAVEAVETTKLSDMSPPYRVAHPEFSQLPVGGEAHGRDNPEQLLGIPNPPQLIVKAATPGLGMSPDELASRTGIVVHSFSSQAGTMESFYAILKDLGDVLQKQQRAEEVTAFFQKQIAELDRRTRDLSVEKQPTVFLGGVSYRGAHGFAATAPHYLPFLWTHANPVITGAESYAVLSPEKILDANPDVVFLDMGTLSLGTASGREELKTHPLFSQLKAVQEGQVYLLLPRASYQTNWECQLANAWFIGKVLYPDRFADVDPVQKANEIAVFLTGKPFSEAVLSQAFQRERVR